MGASCVDEAERMHTEGVPVEDIAATLGVPYATVETWLLARAVERRAGC